MVTGGRDDADAWGIPGEGSEGHRAGGPSYAQPVLIRTEVGLYRSRSPNRGRPPLALLRDWRRKHAHW